jgi:hypothetical protein
MKLLPGHETTDTTPLPNNIIKNYDHTRPQQNKNKNKNIYI